MIVSDILMPVMDGFQLCREVKGDTELEELKEKKCPLGAQRPSCLWMMRILS